VWYFNFNETKIVIATQVGAYSTINENKNCYLTWNIYKDVLPGYPKVNKIISQDSVFISRIDLGVYIFLKMVI
jgi:hypothetical protein